MKTKDSNERVRASLILIKKKWTPETGSTKEQSLLESLKNMQAGGIYFYNTTSETKAAFAERYNTIPEKYTLTIHGKVWIQVYSKIE